MQKNELQAITKLLAYQYGMVQTLPEKVNIRSRDAQVHLTAQFKKHFPSIWQKGEVQEVSVYELAQPEGFGAPKYKASQTGSDVPTEKTPILDSGM